MFPFIPGKLPEEPNIFLLDFEGHKGLVPGSFLNKLLRGKRKKD